MTRRSALALAGVGAFLAPSLARGQDLPKIIVAGPPTDDFKTVYYGIQSGLFRKYGVEVEAQLMGSGAAALAAVVGGAVQVAFTTLPAVLTGYVRGVPFRIVTPGQWYLSEAATTALCVRADSTIKTASDLNGKTIAVQSIKDMNWAATVAWIDQNGGDSKSVRMVEMPFPTVLPAIDEKRIDAGSLPSPFLEQGLNSGKVRILAKALDAIAKRFQFGVYVSTVGYTDANPEAMRRFVRGMHDSIVYTNKHLPETVPIVAAYARIDPAVVAKSVRAIDPEYLDPKEIQPVIDIAFKYKLIDRNVNAEELISTVALRKPR